MKATILSRSLGTAAVAGALVFGVSQAQAAEVFTVDPSVLGGPEATFDANFITGNSSSLLTLDNTTDTVFGSGWVNFSSFTLDGQTVGPATTGLQTDYQLFAEYSYTTSLVSGTLGADGSQYVVTSLNFDLYGTPGLASDFTIADANTGTAATVDHGAGTELIGSGDLIEGVASINALGGTGFNAITTYFNTAFGDDYFVAPIPFPTLAFQEFNNTTQGVERDGDLISINQASGGVDFAVQAIPEPATLGLLALGLLGLGAATGRRRLGAA